MSQNKTNKPSPAVQDNTVWTINGHSFVLDMQDAETAERYESAFAQMEKAEKALPKDGKYSENIRAYCGIFRKLFCALFGEGADVKIMGEKDNTRTAIEAYENLLEFVSGQTATLVETQNRVITRFSPNRAQRRAQGKK